MRNICRFIIVLCMFFISLSANAFCTDISVSEKKHADTISAIRHYNQDFLNTEDNHSVIKNIPRNDTLSVSNRKGDNSLDNGMSKTFLETQSQFQALLSYLYNQSFLHNKSKVHFSVLLSEVRPNAP